MELNLFGSAELDGMRGTVRSNQDDGENSRSRIEKHKLGGLVFCRGNLLERSESVMMGRGDGDGAGSIITIPRKVRENMNETEAWHREGGIDCLAMWSCGYLFVVEVCFPNQEQSVCWKGKWQKSSSTS